MMSEQMMNQGVIFKISTWNVFSQTAPEFIQSSTINESLDQLLNYNEHDLQEEPHWSP